MAHRIAQSAGSDSPLPAQTVVLPTRGWRIDPRKASFAAIACWIGFVLVVVAVERGASASVDSAGLLFWRLAPDFRPRGPGWLLEGVRDMTALGGVLLRNLFAIAAIAALLFVRLRREAVLLGATIVSGWIIDSLIKHFVGRPRPTIVPHLTEAAGTSFPSGHSFNSAVVYIAMALAFAALNSRHSVRATIVAAAMILSLVIALSRVWLGVHYPTDAMAGWLGGAAWAFTASALLYRPAKVVADITATA